MTFEGDDFMEYLEVQGGPDMVTKSELLEWVREVGPISDRQLTYYTSERLIPKSVRIGSRAGAYPRVVQVLVGWIVTQRSRKMPIDAIRELLPLWRAMYRSFHRDGVINLAELELIARETVTSPEAVSAIPLMALESLGCIHCIREREGGVHVVLKDGTEVPLDEAHPLTLGFVIARRDEETNTAKRVMSTTMTLAETVRDDAPTTMILGVPTGIQMEQPGFDGDFLEHPRPSPAEAEVGDTRGG